eukprot:2497577-Lingulodinium_polyedra.AAC.1
MQAFGSLLAFGPRTPWSAPRLRAIFRKWAGERSRGSTEGARASCFAPRRTSRAPVRCPRGG